MINLMDLPTFVPSNTQQMQLSMHKATQPLQANDMFF